MFELSNYAKKCLNYLTLFYFVLIHFWQVNALKDSYAPFQVRASPVKVVEKLHALAVAPEAPVQSVPYVISSAEKFSSQAGGIILFPSLCICRINHVSCSSPLILDDVSQ